MMAIHTHHQLLSFNSRLKQNLVGKILGKIKIFVQDFVPIKTGLRRIFHGNEKLERKWPKSVFLFCSFNLVGTRLVQIGI